MSQCQLCALSFNNDEDLAKHKKAEHKKGEKIPTIVETSAQLIREQNRAFEAGENSAFGFGVGDPVAAGKTKKEEPPHTTTTSTTKKFGEK